MVGLFWSFVNPIKIPSVVFVEFNIQLTKFKFKLKLEFKFKLNGVNMTYVQWG